jgi:hypothetical protein
VRQKLKFGYVDQLELRTDYAAIPADEDSPKRSTSRPETPVLRRICEHVNPEDGRREAWSVSDIPKSFAVTPVRRWPKQVATLGR